MARKKDPQLVFDKALALLQEASDLFVSQAEDLRLEIAALEGELADVEAAGDAADDEDLDEDEDEDA